MPEEGLQGSESFHSRLWWAGELFLVLSGEQSPEPQPVPLPVKRLHPHPPPEEGSGSALRWLWDQPGFAAPELPLQREVPVSACPPAPSVWEHPLPSNRCRPAAGLSWACGGGRGRGRVMLSPGLAEFGMQLKEEKQTLSSFVIFIYVV